MQKPTGQEWRPVAGWEGLYEVSDLGNVWSVRSQCLLKQPPDGGGYPRVSLCLRGNEVTRRTYRLVAAAFLGPRPVDPDTGRPLEVRHLDGIKTHNMVTNLKYGTRSENALDIVRHGDHWEANITHCPQGHEYDEANTYQRHKDRRGRVCRACMRDRARANALARRVKNPTTRRKGHSLPRRRGDDGWVCACGVPLGSTQREARVALYAHCQELRDADLAALVA